MAKLISVSNPERGVSVKGTHLDFDKSVSPEDVARFVSRVYADKLQKKGISSEPIFTEPEVVQPDGIMSRERLIEKGYPHTCETYIGTEIDGNRYHPFILVSEFVTRQNKYAHVLTLTELNDEKRKRYDSLSLLDGTEKRMFDRYQGKDITKFL